MRAQGAIEYIVILGLVIIVALIITAAFGGFNFLSFSIAGKESINEISHLMEDIAFSYKINEIGLVEASARLNKYVEIDNVNLTIKKGGDECVVSLYSLYLNELVVNSTRCDFLNGIVGRRFSYNCTISYIDDLGLLRKKKGLCIGIYEEGLTVGSYVWFSSEEEDFGDGKLSNLTWGSVKLRSNRVVGRYTSPIFNAGRVASWTYLDWGERVPYGEELPSNLGNGNILLLHFNNNITIGENLTNAFDFSGSGNNATLESLEGADFVLGKFNGGLNFDSGPERGYVNMTLGSTVTIALWAKLDAEGDMLWCVDDDNSGPDLWVTNSNIYLNTWDSHANPFCAQPSNIGEWHHYVTVIQSGNTKLYVDGVLCGTASYRDPSESVLFIGSSATGYDIDGVIDEFAVWNRALSEDEVVSLYSRGGLRLEALVRSCDQSNCAGSSWSTIYLNPGNNLSVADNKYFQYRFFFYTDNATFSPILDNVSVHYDINPS